MMMRGMQTVTEETGGWMQARSWEFPWEVSGVSQTLPLIAGKQVCVDERLPWLGRFARCWRALDAASGGLRWGRFSVVEAREERRAGWVSSVRPGQHV